MELVGAQVYPSLAATGPERRIQRKAEREGRVVAAPMVRVEAETIAAHRQREDAREAVELEEAYDQAYSYMPPLEVPNLSGRGRYIPSPITYPCAPRICAQDVSSEGAGCC